MFQLSNDYDIESFKDYFEALIAELPGHVYWKDLNCRFLGCNDAQAKRAGLNNRHDIVGLSAYDVVDSGLSVAERKQQAAAIDKVDKEVMYTGKSISVEEPLILEDGSERIYLSKKVALKDKDGSVVGLLGSSMDITEQKQAENEAKKMSVELEKVSQVKQMFLANMRHDIRTPFTGVIMCAELLAEQECDPEKKAIITDMLLSSQMLLKYLNEILEFTELDNGYVPYVMKSFDFHELVGDCYKLFVPSVSQKDLVFKQVYSSKMPKWIISDRFRLQRILINLVSNAVKYTESGNIDIAIDLIERKKDRQGLLKVVVKDTGCGIPKDKLDAIFERFEMVTPAYKTTNQSIGLGLGAVKDLVESMGGHVYAQSTVGEGSTFVCAIPFEYLLVSDDYAPKIFNIDAIEDVESNESASIVSLQTLQGHKDVRQETKILLVEDVNMAAKIAQHVLQKCGCEVDIAVDAEEAVEKSKKCAYQLILMDIALPGKSGLEATRMIRQLDHHKATPIVALTGHASDSEVNRYQQAGIKEVLTKPLTLKDAQRLIKQHQLKTAFVK